MTRKKQEPEPGPDEESVEAEVREQVEALLAERDQLKTERDETHDRHLRARAELDNFRKRAARERAGMAAAAKRDLVAALLPALDALDLAVRHGDEGAGELLEGVKHARDSLEAALAAQGVERIPTGGAYDPDLHQADAVVQTDQHPEGSIVEELRPGYRVGNLVARHSSVVVAKKPPEPEAREADGENPAVEEDGAEE